MDNDLIRTYIYDKHSGSTNITTHLDHIIYCYTAFGIDWSSRWTYRVFGGFAVSSDCEERRVQGRRVPLSTFPEVDFCPLSLKLTSGVDFASS